VHLFLYHINSPSSSLKNIELCFKTFSYLFLSSIKSPYHSKSIVLFQPCTRTMFNVLNIY
jgi:hypothetical protein